MRFLATVLLLLGTVCVARAQVNAPTFMIDKGNVAQDFSATSAARAELINSLAVVDTLSQPAAKPANALGAPGVVTALVVPVESADPAPPSPKPRFIFGGRDDYRWELGFGVTWFRFQSSVFDANAFGIKTSVAYFTNEWFAIEGNVSAAFAPQIFQNEHVKLATYGAGPKIAWRQRQWEPWLHGIFGGAHEQPQATGFGRNTYSIQAGGGADYRWNPRLSFRLEGDYVRTGFFKQSQNNFQLAGGFVFHF